MANCTYAIHEASQLPFCRLRLTARQAATANKVEDAKYAGTEILTSKSRVMREIGSVIKGESARSSIARPASWDQMPLYSQRTSSSVGEGDQSMPRFRSASRPTVTDRSLLSIVIYKSTRKPATVLFSIVVV